MLYAGVEDVKVVDGGMQAWKAAGYEVVHGAKSLFQAVLIHATKGDSAVYKASFFGRSQVQPMNA